MKSTVLEERVKNIHGSFIGFENQPEEAPPEEQVSVSKITLKDEFIRLVAASPFSEEEKEAIMRAGVAALG